MATNVEEMMLKMNETFPVSHTWNKEVSLTSQSVFYSDVVDSTTPSFQKARSVSDVAQEPTFGSDNTSSEILRMESLLPVTQMVMVQAESSQSRKDLTHVNMVRLDPPLTNAIGILPTLDKENNPGRSAVTSTPPKKVQLKSSGWEDESKQKKKKVLLSTVKTKNKNKKSKTNKQPKKWKTAAKYPSKKVQDKGVKGIKDQIEKPKRVKQRNNLKTKEYEPYFEDHYCPPECACYGRVVQCSDKGITRMPYGTPFNTRYLLLMNNKIDFIQLDLLSEYLSLEFLVLNNNRLTDGGVEGAFEAMPTLTRLFMDANRLSSFPADLPQSLLELRMDDNNISHISEHAVNTCTSLKVLSLERNAITDASIPSGTFHFLRNLKIIRLDFNQLETVPSNLTISLKELFLQHNKITTIPNDVFSQPSELTSIHLNSNQITNKGIKKKAFRNMKTLETLNMASNLLKVVPKHLPKSLKTLILSENRITSVEKDAFKKLKNLTEIILTGNKILSIEAGAFAGLLALEHLDLSNNQLLEVPRRLPLTLRTLHLFNNQIRRMPEDSFCGAQNAESRLVLVRLENNKMRHSSIDPHALRCLRGYQVVHFY
ncbi:decorin-like [Ambystoma mexicanum]|uniref:decorin-like n=1 Tax=Ambystoma mexicanum TaxID=8296 RepID=UPI0037E7257C